MGGGGREKNNPTFFLFFLGTQQSLGGGALSVTERGGANSQSYATVHDKVPSCGVYLVDLN